MPYPQTVATPPKPRCSALFSAPRMQTSTQSLKRKPNSSSSSSSSTSEDEPVTSSAYTIHHLIPCPQPPPSVKAQPAAAPKVPYIHTPPHQHTPYTTLCHAHSHLPSCRSRPNQPLPLRCHTSIHHHTPYTTLRHIPSSLKECRWLPRRHRIRKSRKTACPFFAQWATCPLHATAARLAT